MSFSKEIKMVRQRLYMTQSDFANELNVSFATVNRWETGKAHPSISTMKTIKEFCENHNVDYSSVENAWLIEEVKPE